MYYKTVQAVSGNHKKSIKQMFATKDKTKSYVGAVRLELNGVQAYDL
jgi:hypothetical protein